MQSSDKPAKNIQSVHRALDILECIVQDTTGLKLGDIAERCGLNKTTAFHLVKTLEARGYVEQSYDTQLYKVGWKSFETFTEFYQKNDIRPVAVPYMDKIRERIDETVTLYYYLRIKGYYMGLALIQMESTQPLRFSSKLGYQIPLHCTAAGKVRFLGYDDEMLRDQLQRMPFPAYTPATVTDPQTLLGQLVEIRQRGYCIEREEFTPGISSVAVPIFKFTGRVVYAMNVSTPSSRATDAYLQEIADTLMEILSVPSGYPDFIFKGAPL